jgi:hypothetical protein
VQAAPVKLEWGDLEESQQALLLDAVEETVAAALAHNARAATSRKPSQVGAFQHYLCAPPPRTEGPTLRAQPCTQ